MATPERKTNRGYNMALPNVEVMPGGDGGRHLTCGLGVSFAGCVAKQGLGLFVANGAPNPGLREDEQTTKGVRVR